MSPDNRNEIGKTLKQRRLMLELTVRELAARSSVSASHLARVEWGERFPSGHILRKIAKPLAFDERELFTLAGFLSLIPTEDTKEKSSETVPRLDPYVASVLAQEPVEVQRAVIGILSILRSLARSILKE